MIRRNPYVYATEVVVCQNFGPTKKFTHLFLVVVPPVAIGKNGVWLVKPAPMRCDCD